MSKQLKTRSKTGRQTFQESLGEESFWREKVLGKSRPIANIQHCARADEGACRGFSSSPAARF
jgi:hypothetical protein